MGCKMIPMLSILVLLLSLSLLLLASSTTSTRVGKMGNREIRRNLIYGGPKVEHDHPSSGNVCRGPPGGCS
ncbi:hypothetical protein Gogos_003333 [Gossypium gossypioides]|uniref:Transmembrane protein n=1 Tax=Gossypium gossypioides TaxID=34282 RepID=A0A7J9CLP0_GOSGO|nr:hypothetical protein [Gossypium gossypioides]